MAAKTQLSNKLLGMFVTPMFGIEHLWNFVEAPAEIVAAFLEDGNVRVAVVDSIGHTAVLPLMYVRLHPTSGDANMRMLQYNEYKKAIEALRAEIEAAPAGTRRELVEKVMELERQVQQI